VNENLNSDEGKLPARDFFLLPLLSVATVAVMFAGSEIIARQVYESGGKDPCWVSYDPRLGTADRPNCTARIKVFESPWVEHKFNECGYRTPESCGPKRAGTIRVALMGASVAEGYLIPYKDTFAAQASRLLSEQSGRKVEIQNLAVEGCGPLFVCRRMGEALALKPDLVLWILSPYDLEQDIPSELLSRRNDLAPIEKAKTPAAPMSLAKKLQIAVADSRTLFAAQHLAFQNQDLYIKLYLMQAERAGFLTKPLPPRWLKRAADLDVLLGDMAEKTRRSGVPFAVAVAPQRAQSALASMRVRPPHIDPYVFEKTIEEIAFRHRVITLPVLSEFGSLSNPETLYYPVDGHLSGEGQTVLARAVVRGLVKDVALFSVRADSNGPKMASLQ
jgi:hypothetical protein